MSSENDALLIRPGTVADVPYVVRAWVDSYEREGETAWRTTQPQLLVYARMLDPRTPPQGWQGHNRYFYRVMQTELVNRLLARSRLTVAASREDPDTLAGFLVDEPERRVVHYVYVRHTFRRNGIARALCGACVLDGPRKYTQRTRELAAIQLPREWEFRPLEILE